MKFDVIREHEGFLSNDLSECWMCKFLYGNIDRHFGVLENELLHNGLACRQLWQVNQWKLSELEEAECYIPSSISIGHHELACTTLSSLHK